MARKATIPAVEAAHPPEPFRFVDLLRAQATAASTKGERTQLRLKAAAAEALEATSYHLFKISDVTQGAEVSYGLFYHYYPDKLHIAQDVLRDFIDETYRRYQGIHRGKDIYESIYAANLFYVELYRLNAGLMAAVFAVADEDATFRAFWCGVVHAWHERIARVIAAQPDAGGTPGGAMLAAYALGGMIDQLCLQLYVNATPELGQPSTHEVAETLTRIWHRAVYAR